MIGRCVQEKITDLRAFAGGEEEKKEDQKITQHSKHLG